MGLDFSASPDQDEDVQDEVGYYSNESNFMLRDSKYAASNNAAGGGGVDEPQFSGGIQVFKQHHLPSFSRVTEKADEEDRGDEEDDEDDDSVVSLN